MRIAYYRVSTGDQSVSAQRHALGGNFEKEFSDEGVSGGVMAAERPGFAKLLDQVRGGDTVCVYAVDRLGRDAIDVQSTVKRLIESGVILDVRGVGVLAGDTAKLILAVLAQLAEMERTKIRERTAAGREAARASLAATGRTHRGKESLGRPKARDGAEVVTWRRENGASIAQTAEHFGLSVATVKRYQASHAGGMQRAPSQPASPPVAAAESVDVQLDPQYARPVEQQAAGEHAEEGEAPFPWQRRAWPWTVQPTTINVDTAGRARVVSRKPSDR